MKTLNSNPFLQFNERGEMLESFINKYREYGEYNFFILSKEKELCGFYVDRKDGLYDCYQFTILDCNPVFTGVCKFEDIAKWVRAHKFEVECIPSYRIIERCNDTNSHIACCRCGEWVDVGMPYIEKDTPTHFKFDGIETPSSESKEYCYSCSTVFSNHIHENTENPSL